MHVVAVTTSHRGDDARIVHRQARCLLEQGHRVTLVAPDPGQESRRLDPPGLDRVIVPRASGRRRMGAWWAARRAVAALRAEADVVLIHDLELVPVITLARRRRTRFVWDVHEDFVAMASDTAWLPVWSRPLLRGCVHLLERWARLRCRLVIAEEGYAARFPSAPVVPNTTWVPEAISPPDDDPRVVYVGRVSFDRGARELVALGELLVARSGPRVVIVGPADADCAALLADAQARGVVDWRGPLPNPEAMRVLDGATAGLSLLHDTANYRVSRPTKVIEYLAHGVPVISTPLPHASEVIARADAGFVTKGWSGDAVVREVAEAVKAYAHSRNSRAADGERGWRYVRDHASWNTDGARFVAILERFANGAR